MTLALSSPDSERTDFSAGPSASRLRRKRSSASAALTSRPSMLNIGSLVPSLETCVLLHTSSSNNSSGSGSRRLIHALFEPNFFVDGIKGSIQKLDRTTWETIRADVEDLRIVAQSSPAKATSSEHGLPTPASSPQLAPASLDGPSCTFDLTSSTDERTNRSVSHFFIQPRPYTSLPAKNCHELLELEIRGVGDGILLPHRWSVLPDQVQKILYDADLLSNSQGSVSMTELTSSMQEGMAFNTTHDRVDHVEDVCSQILQIIKDRE